MAIAPARNSPWVGRLLGLLVVLMLATGVSADVPPGGKAAVVSVSGPPIQYSSQKNSTAFVFIYHQNDDIYDHPRCTLILDGYPANSARVTAGAQAQFGPINFSRTSHTWQIQCEGANSTNGTLTILPLDPPRLYLVAPADGSHVTGPVVDFRYEYDSGSDELASSACTLVVGPILQAQGNATSGTESVLVSKPLNPVAYPWSVHCARADWRNKALETKPWIVNVDAPVAPANLTPPSTPTIFNSSQNDSTFASQQVTINAPASAKPGESFRLVLKALDGTPVAGAHIIAYSADGAKTSLPPTDERGEASFTPMALGDYSYSVENLLLVQKSDTQVTASGQPENAPTPTVAVEDTATSGTPTTSSGSGSSVNAGAVTDAGSNTGAVAPSGNGQPGASNTGANGPGTSAPSTVQSSGIPLWLMVAGAGLAALAIGAAWMAFGKPPADDFRKPPMPSDGQPS